MVLADNQVSPPASQQPAEANVLRAINRAHNEFAPPARTEINPDMDPLLPDLGDASSRAVSSEDERLLVEQIRREIYNDPSYLRDPLLTDYLTDLGRRLAAGMEHAHLGTQTFDFFAVRDKTVNAFAMPGGFIGVHTGLLAMAESESELASVLGHEMGHVLQKHYARGQDKNGKNIWLTMAGVALGVLAASRNSSAAQGLMVGGQALAINNALVFSRDAEREADRVGFQIMQSSGFNPDAMPLFFERLQRVNTINELGQISYVRTHPLTSERIADMQNRVRLISHQASPPTSLGFYLARARARVLQTDGFDGLQALKKRFVVSADTDLITTLTASYGRALVEQALGNLDEAERALNQARQTLEKNTDLWADSVSIEVTAIEIALARQNPDQALSLSEAALRRFPNSRALNIDYVRTLIASRRYDKAVSFSQAKTKSQPNEQIWWELLAETFALQGKQVEQHRALAERYALLSSWAAALEQLQIARRIGDADFYVMSEIDARIHQIERLVRESAQQN